MADTDEPEAEHQAQDDAANTASAPVAEVADTSVPLDLLTPSPPASVALSWEPSPEQIEAAVLSHPATPNRSTLSSQPAPDTSSRSGRATATPHSICAWPEVPSRTDSPQSQQQHPQQRSGDHPQQSPGSDALPSLASRRSRVSGKHAPQSKTSASASPRRFATLRSPASTLRGARPADAHVIPTKAAGAIQISRMSPHASTTFRAPHAAQVGLDALPSELRPNTGKLRRLQAAQVSQHGPPQRAFALRPLMPEAEDRMLDVDLVLQACDLQSPADAQEIRMDNQGIVSIDAESIAQFTNARSVHLDSNRLTDVSALAALPNLLHIGVPCNRIHALPQCLASGAFASLRSLDISFNFLRAQDIFGAASGPAQLPCLRDLDASGNDLRALPAPLSGFAALTGLSLEFNKLNDNCLQPLAALPKLERLGLAHNVIAGLPDGLLADAQAFDALTSLDLSCNVISDPAALRALQAFRRGASVYVGGNPIANKMRLHLLDPSAVPGCAAGTVASSASTNAAHTTSVHTRGRACLKAPLSGQEQTSADAAVRDSVVLKLERDAPERPTLAKSLASGRHMVSSELDTAAAPTLAFPGLEHDKLVQVFERLKGEIDSWQALATVQEEEAEGMDAEIGRTFLTDVAVDQQMTSPASPSAPTPRVPSPHAHGGDADADAYADPTEKLAYLLGLDPLLLTHHTGLHGHDVRGAVARLKFALAHPVTRAAAGAEAAAAHLKLTQSVAAKQRPRKVAPLISLPPPPSPHFQQVETIQAVLAGMKERLERVQAQVAAQLQEYSHLVRTQTTGVSHSDSAEQTRGETSQAAPFLVDVVLGNAAWQAQSAPADMIVASAEENASVNGRDGMVPEPHEDVGGTAGGVAGGVEGEISFGLRVEGT